MIGLSLHTKKELLKIVGNRQLQANIVKLSVLFFFFFFYELGIKEIITYFREVLQFRRWIKVQSTVRGPGSWMRLKY